jgi:hypothetical protein
VIEWFYVSVIGILFFAVANNTAFLIKLEENASDIYKMLQKVYGERAVNRTVFR